MLSSLDQFAVHFLLFIHLFFHTHKVLAPFVFIQPPPKGSQIPFSLFEAFLFRYLERYFCLDESLYLFKAFRLFHILLVYHDPQLALHLHEQGFPPELYAPQWFLTLYSRSLPIQHVLRLWDLMIAVDDPAFTFFIGLCLLRRLRCDLLLADVDRIPETISKICLTGEQDVDAVAREALEAYRQTPRCLCRNLRLCCVTSPELNPKSSPQKHAVRSIPAAGVNDEDVAMAAQSVRACVMISPQELVTSLAPVTGFAQVSTEGTDHLPQQFVVIDMRSQEDAEEAGAGILPKAIRLEPEFVDKPDAFAAWLQHFDGTRGCNICIIDMPPAHLPSVALWRRLLLGEGDGRSKNSVVYGRTGEARAGDGTGVGEGLSIPRDLQSPFLATENEIVATDAVRPAVRLAEALQREAFPYVSLLEGGFPALVNHLKSSRGSVEPVIINHEPEQWDEYLRATGRAQHASAVQEGTMSPKRKSRVANGVRSEGRELPVLRRASDLSDVEKLELAVKVAARLGHNHMQAILLEKINALNMY